MGLLGEQILVYGIIFLMCAIIVGVYLYRHRKQTRETLKKVEIAKEEGLHEPVSLYPHIDLNTCIGSAACIVDCPEKDILGMVDGKVTVVNTTNCVGHGACFHACPVEAISLRIGTEKRGVDLPHVNQSFESNMQGIYIAGELGGMGLIKNSIEQGSQAIKNMVKNNKPTKEGVHDVVIIGAGPAGIAATLEAKKQGFKAVTLEQESLGGTVATYPRNKIVLTSPMELPLHGVVKMKVTNKDELLTLWHKVIDENDLKINERVKVEAIIPMKDNTFKVKTNTNETYLAKHVLMAIGRRGSPRKLNCPGEESQKVAYRLLDPEQISGKKIMVVGGGDSAVESAMLLMDQNDVILSYRKDKFSRIKPKNRERILECIDNQQIDIRYNSNVVSIMDDRILLEQEGNTEEVANDLVYIFAGGELPTSFLQNAGVQITKRFNYILKQHA